nr:BrnT family toxin [uncultured Devosia sp.]
MPFEWDDDKDRLNQAKHGIAFAEAQLIFEGPVYSWTDQRFDHGETRSVSIGLVRGVVAVAVVHTDRNGVTRRISARLANRRERTLYDEHFR